MAEAATENGVKKATSLGRSTRARHSGGRRWTLPDSSLPSPSPEGELPPSVFLDSRLSCCPFLSSISSPPLEESRSMYAALTATGMISWSVSFSAFLMIFDLVSLKKCVYRSYFLYL
ncbi:unnamed protein product [Musa textilis]